MEPRFTVNMVTLAQPQIMFNSTKNRKLVPLVRSVLLSRMGEL